MDETVEVAAEHAGGPPANPATKVAATGKGYDDVDLAVQNAELTAENAQLKQAAQSQRLGKLLSELRFLGKLTPGLEQAGAAEILAAAYGLSDGRGGSATRPAGSQTQPYRDGGKLPPPQGDAGVMVELPDGQSMSLGEALANLLYAIPPSWGGEGAYAGVGAGATPAHLDDEPHGRAWRPPLPGNQAAPRPRLSAQEREVARALGLSAEEYVGMTQQG